MRAGVPGAAGAVALSVLIASPADAGVVLYDYTRATQFGFYTGKAGRWICEDVFLDLSGLDLANGTASFSKLSAAYYTKHWTRVEMGIWTAPLNEQGDALVGVNLTTIKAGWVGPGTGTVTVDISSLNIPVRETLWVGVRFLDTAWGAFLNADPAVYDLSNGRTNTGRAVVPDVGYMTSSEIRFDTSLALAVEAEFRAFPPPPIPAPGVTVLLGGGIAGGLMIRRRRS